MAYGKFGSMFNVFECLERAERWMRMIWSLGYNETVLDYERGTWVIYVND